MQSNHVIPWPDGVCLVTGLQPATLEAKRRSGDAPQLYAIGSRSLVTTNDDLIAWVQSKPVPADYKMREATR